MARSIQAPTLSGQTQGSSRREPCRPAPDDDGNDDAPGIQAAIDSGKPVIYFPRAKYTLKSDVIVHGTVKKLDFLFSQFFAEKGSEAVIRIEQGADQQVVLENIDRHLPLIHDSAGVVVVRNQVGRHWGPLKTVEDGRECQR